MQTNSITPVRCAALTAAFLSLVVIARLLGGGGDFSRFVLASEPRADANQVPEVLTLGEKEYDGQFFYRLALGRQPRVEDASSRPPRRLGLGSPADQVLELVGVPRQVEELVSAGRVKHVLVPSILESVDRSVFPLPAGPVIELLAPLRERGAIGQSVDFPLEQGKE